MTAGYLVPFYFTGMALAMWCMEVWAARLCAFFARRVEKTRQGALGAIVAGGIDDVEKMRLFAGTDVRCVLDITTPDGTDWRITVERDVTEPRRTRAS